MSELSPPTETVSVLVDAKCLGCGYSLRYLTQPRCPECGRSFDPQDYESYDNHVRRRLKRAARLGGLPIGLFAIAAIATGIILGGMLGFGLRVIPGAIAVGLLVRGYALPLAALFPYDLDAELTSRFKRWKRWAWASTIILLLFGTVNIWGCVHGYGVQIGPFAITYTGRAGMCWEHVNVASRVELSEHISLYRQ